MKDKNLGKHSASGKELVAAIVHSKRTEFVSDKAWGLFLPSASLPQIQAPFAFSILFSCSETMFLLECLLDGGSRPNCFFLLSSGIFFPETFALKISTDCS